MEIYNKKDLDTFDKNIKDIVKKAKIQSLKNSKPSKKEIDAVNNIILEYVRKKKRKIYGGYALNEIIRNKNKEDTFYDDDTEIADIDIYSNNPIEDIFNVCDLLADKGYKRIVGEEAVHEGTYKIFWEFTNVLDVSYVPSNVYNNIPFEEINEIRYTHPSFIKIDSFRMFTQPFFFEQRLEKQFKRFQIIEKYYKMKRITKPLNVKKISNNKMDLMNNVLIDIYKFIINNSSVILFDDYSYNYYKKESKIKNNYIKNIKLNNFKIISTDFENDCKSVCKLIKNKYKDDYITKVEYYGFFQFLGRSMVLLLDGHPVLSIYDNDKKCLPFQQIEPLVDNLKVNLKKNDFVNISTFDLTLLFSLIFWIKNKVDKNSEKIDMYNYLIMSSHLVQMKHNYFKNNDKTIFDDTPFEEFIISCKGIHHDSLKEHRLKIEKKVMEKKGPYKWKYQPLTSRTKKKPNYDYINTSGSIIKNNNELIIDC